MSRIHSYHFERSSYILVLHYGAPLQPPMIKSLYSLVKPKHRTLWPILRPLVLYLILWARAAQSLYWLSPWSPMATWGIVFCHCLRTLEMNLRAWNKIDLAYVSLFIQILLSFLLPTYYRITIDTVDLEQHFVDFCFFNQWKKGTSTY